MKLVLPAQQAGEVVPRVRAILPDATWVVLDGDQVQGDGRGAEIWLRGFHVPSTDRVLEQLPDLRWIHAISAGVEQAITPELVRRRIILTNSAGAYARPIAESVLALILAVVKRLPDHIRNQEQAAWESYEKDELPGKTLGVIGLGAIGRQTVAMVKVLGMRAIGTVSHYRPLDGIDEVFPADQVHQMAGQSDFLLVAAPSTPATYHLVNQQLLRSMKPTAWLINIARGNLVDEQALLQALRQGWIGGACLDVFEHEPLPPDSPFWKLPNVIITPHNTGSTQQAFTRARDIFYQNLVRYIAGQPLMNVVDLEAGY